MTTTTLIEVEGALLAVQHAPNASSQLPPVVLLHANVADHRMWQAQWDGLAAHRTVVSYDRRGFGESRTLAPVPHMHVADLWRVMDSLGLSQAVLVGCSMGGRIAIDAALAQPDRICGLALIAPGVTGAPAPQHCDAVAAQIHAISVASDRGDLSMQNALQAHLWLDGPLSPQGRVGGKARELFLRMNGTALRAPSPGKALDAPSAWAQLESIKVPALVLWGDLDLPQLQERCELLAQRLPRARRVVLSGTAHLPPLEAPGRFNAALANYLATIDLEAGLAGGRC